MAETPADYTLVGRCSVTCESAGRGGRSRAGARRISCERRAREPPPPPPRSTSRPCPPNRGGRAAWRRLYPLWYSFSDFEVDPPLRLYLLARKQLGKGLMLRRRPRDERRPRRLLCPTQAGGRWCLLGPEGKVVLPFHSAAGPASPRPPPRAATIAGGRRSALQCPRAARTLPRPTIADRGQRPGRATRRESQAPEVDVLGARSSSREDRGCAETLCACHAKGRTGLAAKRYARTREHSGRLWRAGTRRLARRPMDEESSPDLRPKGTGIDQGPESGCFFVTGMTDTRVFTLRPHSPPV